MNADDRITTESLVREIQAMADELCPHCDQPVSLEDALRCRAFGSKRRPKCFAGLADFLGESADVLDAQLQDYFEQRDCYRGAWEWIQSHNDE
ncbi:MAG: hypothetical protein CMO80_13875 [Verrucomicrobiales bacterium]|nr:hypothetical protein [Verrucomicrobiales bacterium]|tara:strand:- start:2833 stop:3111 length:279 start_codon:yes stop_codon:yes gene_type:complete